MFQATELSGGYLKGSQVLRGISLALERGSVTALMGRNGMGKTTLMRAITGHLPHLSGSMRLNDQELTKRAAFQVAQLGVGYVPQGRDIFADFSVEENLMMGVLGKPGLSRTLPEWAWTTFPVLAERRRQRAGTMSGGQQQQLAIMRALVGRPQLLLLDEPSEGIQPSIVMEIGATIRRIAAEQGLAVLLVEQNLDLVRAMAGRCLFIESGAIADAAEVDALHADAPLVRRYLSA
ncbi:MULTISPECIES: ABC transporter ATP-binding protein [unclassified Variovorax]|uniref:ABC transporter ATP-binding protein n=1 Tax=unclassified Variovorax TaxID=663243 RepID=UPI001317CD26|nr:MULTISPECIES: ABC transporter ATP-binding protein [unclassified Variovorax]VTU22215.1 LIV-I protein F [Variovorax sp. SRS16]VTU30383.1 LIV-I protein F [Variovorax sp. PBL-E5]